jgi:hypothetical protein
VAHRQIAAGRERIAQRGHHPPGILGVVDEVQDRNEQQPDRLGKLITLRVAPELRIFSGSRRSAPMTAVFPLPARRALLCAIATGSAST